MEFQVTERGEWGREIRVVVPAESVERRMESLVEHYRRRAALPGFRQGKAPTDLVRVQFQGSIESDLLNDLIPEAYDEAIRDLGLSPVAPPRIHGIRFQPGEPLVFLADIEIHPDIEVGGYRGLVVDQEILEVDETMLDEAIQMMRRNRAALSKVERASEAGDVVQAILEPVDVHGKKLPSGKKEEVRIEVGSPTLLPEFREATMGISAGETRVVTVEYPQEFGDAELAGKTRRFRLTAKEIDEKILPELDDNFARSIDSGLDLEGLRAKLRLRLESEELLRSKQRLEDRLVERLMEGHPFQVPERMVSYRLERAIERAREETEDLDEEAFRERYRGVVERICRRDILMEAIIRKESLQLAESEVEAELDKMAEEAGVETAVLKRKVEGEGDLDRLRDTMQERKVLDFLVANAQVNRVKKPRTRAAGSVEAGTPR